MWAAIGRIASSAKAARRSTLAVLGLNGEDPRELGPYRLRAVIGDGGMGRVYLGTSPAGRAVAVKVIGPGLADQPGYRQRFAREANAAMAVSGIYTASVVSADTEGERPYIATEFVAAPSLADAVQTARPLPAATVSALAGGLAEKVEADLGISAGDGDVKRASHIGAPIGPPDVGGPADAAVSAISALTCWRAGVRGGADIVIRAFEGLVECRGWRTLGPRAGG